MRHGKSGTRAYIIWKNMMRRCYAKSLPTYHHYGGRGITVCDKWKYFTGFYEDMGDPSNSKLSLDRIDGNGNYCKENCRWATREEQNNNNTQNIKVEHDGKTLTIGQWAKKLGMKYTTLYMRIKRGWQISDSFNRDLRSENGRYR